MKKIFLLFVKYLPVIQMAGFLFNNTMYCYYDTYTLAYMLDFILGNSIAYSLLMYVVSYVFKFCIWYRLIITANLANTAIAVYDANCKLPVKDVTLLIIYYIIASIAIIIATYIHVKYDKHTD